MQQSFRRNLNFGSSGNSYGPATQTTRMPWAQPSNGNFAFIQSASADLADAGSSSFDMENANQAFMGAAADRGFNAARMGFATSGPTA